MRNYFRTRYPMVMAHARPDKIDLPTRMKVDAFTDTSLIAHYDPAIKALAKDDNVLTLYGTVGEDYWSGEGITARKVAAQLKAIGERDVEVHLNSPGGNLFEGIAIYNVLRDHPQSVTVKIMGIAASAASVVAMAGDQVLIGQASFLMIHNAHVVAAGNRHDFAETSAFLEPFDKAMASVYAKRSGMKQSDIEAMMDAETYLDGATAVEKGFADALLDDTEAVRDEAGASASTDINKVRALEHDLIKAGHTRTQARALIKEFKGMPGAVLGSGTRDAAEDWVAEAQSLLAKLKGN